MAVKVSDMTVAILSLSVTVILITMVLAPVISDVISDSSSGYTNTGEYYYKTAVEGENHTLTLDTAGNNVTIAYDGTVIHTIPMGDTGWSIPLFLTDITSSNTPRLYSLNCLVDGVSNGGSLSKTLIVSAYSLWGDTGGSNGFLPITYHITGTAITEESGVTLRSYMADTGNLVLAESPVIDPEQYIYTSQCFQLAPTTPVDNIITIKYAVIQASGTLSTIGTGKTWVTESDGTSVAGMDYDWTTYTTAGQYQNWYNCDSVDDGLVSSEITVRTTSTEDGLRLNGIDALIHWDGQPTDTVTLTKFVVPVEVGEGSGDSEISPTLKSMISIIPLIVTVGIVLSAITMIRMKN